MNWRVSSIPHRSHPSCESLNGRSGTCECHSGWAGKACSDFIAEEKNVPRLLSEGAKKLSAR